MARSVPPMLPGALFVRAAGRLGAAVLLLFLFALLTRAEVPVSPDTGKAEALMLDKKLINQVKEGPDLMANLTYLSDMIGARLTGSPALKRANEWTAEKMRSYGLSNVHLEPWTIPVGWERGTAYARIVEPDNGRSLAIASMGWSPGTKGKVVGDVIIIKAKNAQELAPYKGKLKDAIVLQGPPATVRTNFTPTPPGERGGRGRFGGPGADGQGKAPKDGAKQGRGQADGQQGGPSRRDLADWQQRMAFRRELSDFLRTEGAACILMDAGKPQGLLNMTGSWRSGGSADRVSAAEPIPSAFIAHEHYALLYRLAGRPAPERTRLEIEITNKLTPGPITVYNTVGEIPGSEKPDEVVIVGAHLDSWDLGQGTTDNGTGTCVVLETARTLMRAGVKPKRTIRFCLFTGEEEGLFGSRAYVQAHKDELPKISLCLVHDTGTGKVIGLGLQGRASVKPILESELVSLKELGLQDINLRGMGGSDHQSFENAGVPGFAVQQDMSEYNFTHHSQSDTLDKVHVDDLVEGVQVMAVAAVRVANLPKLLPRDKPPGSERRGRGGFFQDEAPKKAADAAQKPPADKK
ncbi:MAG TPA: M20/M25/M40 family metallo-hydrolase [Gemmataceae bacterium]|nr:M20/M25/M40 family metallo-hydrolase [Gemmataceae bacterium]